MLLHVLYFSYSSLPSRRMPPRNTASKMPSCWNFSVCALFALLYFVYNFVHLLLLHMENSCFAKNMAIIVFVFCKFSFSNAIRSSFPFCVTLLFVSVPPILHDFALFLCLLLRVLLWVSLLKIGVASAIATATAALNICQSLAGSAAWAKMKMVLLYPLSGIAKCTVLVCACKCVYACVCVLCCCFHWMVSVCCHSWLHFGGLTFSSA